MTTLFNYLLRNKEKSFDDMYFNEVDLLLINELSYFPLDHYVTNSFDVAQAFTLSKLAQVLGPSLPRLHQYQSLILTRDRIELFNIMANSIRYSNIKLYAFYNQISIDIELQFSALCFDIPNQYTLVAFRGTDDSIIGWKEDAYMAFQQVIPAQQMAADYLNAMPIKNDKPILLSGHSKGGNLAVYAASQANIELQNQIQVIFSFDGPGFQPQINNTQQMQAICRKLIHIIPEDSIVGMMLEHNVPALVIKSRNSAFVQHDPINWIIVDNHFEVIDSVSDFSRLVDLTIKEWTNQLNEEDMKRFIDIIFDLIDQTQIQRLEEINQNKVSFFRSFFTYMNALDVESRQFIDEIVMQLVQIFRNLFKEYRNQSLVDMKDKAIQWFKPITFLEYFTTNFPSLINKEEEISIPVKPQNQPIDNEQEEV
ncbi:Mbeg1-like protein [Fundicoccus culcitae]|uniref:DUF2974 domain-containing protein n=1 Tax=Fundicoccus culcitae TaxID=2969821 RepID=A0ABY5P8D6_9LACT|nr:Mbeg1-like protein [Fundicoccus culcitae]UUX34648.1 DUF2974 domain-containing protein [Fundicoccus culcitae]